MAYSFKCTVVYLRLKGVIFLHLGLVPHAYATFCTGSQTKPVSASLSAFACLDLPLFLINN